MLILFDGYLILGNRIAVKTLQRAVFKTLTHKTMIKLFNAASLFVRIVWRRIDENEADSRMDWLTAWAVSKGIWFGFPKQPCSQKPDNCILKEEEEEPPF